MSIFVASPVDVSHDAEADERLRTTNDVRFATPDGILTVDANRWQQAQQYERETWLTHNLNAVSDRNEDHMANFGNYVSLPKWLGDCLEVGCGPFTNLNLIFPGGHGLDSVTLLDPLIMDYVQFHPHCTYADGWMHGCPTTLIASALEDYEPSRHYDTVVMINVLPHCYDANKALDVIYKCLRPSATLVFNEGYGITTPDTFYDVGHPLQIRKPTIDKFLSRFEPLYTNGAYFIGKFKG